MGVSGEVLVWLSLWSEVQVICICHSIISCFINSRFV